MAFKLKNNNTVSQQNVGQQSVDVQPNMAMQQTNMQQTQPSPSVQQQQMQQMYVNQQQTVQQQNAPVFTKSMYNQMKQLMQMEQAGTILPEQSQYLAKLKNQYMLFQQYRQNSAGGVMGTQVQPQMMSQTEAVPTMSPQDNTPKKKKFPLVPVIIGVIVLLILALAIKSKLSNNTKTEVMDPSQTGRYVIDNVVTALNTYDADTLDTLIGSEQGDSYLAQEYAYTNNVPLRVEFIKKVGSMVTVEYPSTTDKKGNVLVSDMLNGESCTVTVPDYTALMQAMDSDESTIKSLYESAHISPTTTYTYQDDWFNLFCQYFVDNANVTTTQKEITFNLAKSVDGTLYMKDDSDIDQLLFSSDEFHAALDKFSQICIGYTGYKDETYTEEELVHNEEYDRWFDLFLQYFTADGGVYDPATKTFSNVQNAFNPKRSKWEPFYLRDDNNNIQLNEDGTYVVNYFSVKDENGKDWIQPSEEVYTTVEKTRQVEDPWEDERGIWYNNCGTYYLENIYKGKGLTIFRVGDGSIENPAGIGTPIITKVFGSDGEYHDVEVTLLAYWTGQDAIDYVQKFDTRNRGFNINSVVQLIAYEISVRNLDGATYTFNSEMALCDKNSNTSARTGTMYSFSKDISITEGQTIIINDWANSTELNQKYVVWGKTFARTYPYVYFRILAGEGNVPTYSAYDYFVTNNAHISDESVQYTQDSVTSADTATEVVPATEEQTEETTENTEETTENAETPAE